MSRLRVQCLSHVTVVDYLNCVECSMNLINAICSAGLGHNHMAMIVNCARDGTV